MHACCIMLGYIIVWMLGMHIQGYACLKKPQSPAGKRASLWLVSMAINFIPLAAHVGGSKAKLTMCCSEPSCV